MDFTVYGVKIPIKSLILPLLYSTPFVIIFTIVMIMWHYDSADKNMILIVILTILLVTIAIGRIWNRFFEFRKNGKQKKLDRFLKD